MTNIDNSDQKIWVIPTNGIRPSLIIILIITFVDELRNGNGFQHSRNRSSNSVVCVSCASGKPTSTSRNVRLLWGLPWWLWLPPLWLLQPLLPPRLRILSPLVASLLVASLVALSLVVLEELNIINHLLSSSTAFCIVLLSK